MYSYIRFDTQYAVWISCRANVAPKSNLIQLGSAHEWSGVWTGPKMNVKSKKYFTGLKGEFTEVPSRAATCHLPDFQRNLAILNSLP